MWRLLVGLYVNNLSAEGQAKVSNIGYDGSMWTLLVGGVVDKLSDG